MKPSPIFLGVVAVAAAGGALAWTAEPTSTWARAGVFVLVLAGWIVSVCLHEFGHAFTAFRAGDREVQLRGYLTLNPLKYSHPLLSVVLPIVFIAIGGIGLPGGAVYVRSGLFAPRVQRRIALAGPTANALIAVLLLVVIRIWGMNGDHLVFWWGLSFLAFLQVMATILNLLPVPGLDGYAALEPYLSYDTRRALANFKGYGILVLVAFLFVPAVNSAFFGAIYWIFGLSGIPEIYAQYGNYLMRFWA
ncbi:site-2 protease family protein [Rhodococcus sp. PAMC28707]|uniref:site-2 protease family protein n=1 Tax=unclassified Rhodococcus (in: high G+C Gram-positive bacteria) TaxID=192944 RepID=UPI00109DAD59|nr:MULTISPECIES: site-2 protease family protein [unclassified Rhodococcus (in: high G+C Gram-positive bacteria)]QCB49044.1 site-2 protease family protein [Rhodococcus sp. PAMC28705]QCB59268.1 site-2 protease family protein [Rhodococcus sp. PAMC28707]